MRPDTDAFASRDGQPRTVIRTRFICSRCEATSAFDGLGGEWCPNCETAEHLAKSETLYQLVDVAPVTSFG